MSSSLMFVPISRAVSQLGDAALLGVLWRSVVWAVGCFAALHFGVVWAVHQLLQLSGLQAWALDALGTIATWLLAFWLFVPVAAAIGTLYLDRIAAAVERRFYPWLQPARGAPIVHQIWDGVAVAVNILVFNIVALMIAILLPGAGLVLGWLVAAYGIGRGLFVAVCMRRMSRGDAETIYRTHRMTVLFQGGILALIGYVPVANVLLPVLGTAAMVHVLDMTAGRGPARWSRGFGATSV